MLLKSVSFKKMKLIYCDALLIHLTYSKKAHRTHQQTIKFYTALLEYVVIIDCVKIKVKENFLKKEKRKKKKITTEKVGLIVLV